MMVTSKKRDDFVESLPNTNVVIAAMTTAHARLKLYSYIKRLGDAILYFDTDRPVEFPIINLNFAHFLYSIT